MKRAHAAGLSHKEVRRLLSEIQDQGPIGARIQALSRRFLGRAYKVNPLIGSVSTPEVFTASVDSFDCLTFVETVIALARAGACEDFIRWLRRIRYDGGRIVWKHRNHYMTGWIRNNMRGHIIGPVPLGDIPTVSRERILNAVPGLAPRRIRLRCVPKKALPRLRIRLRTGDVIFFASTRRNLDVFHCAIVVRDDNKILLRHASRSRGKVVEQKLEEFARQNRMAGLIAVRPREMRGGGLKK